MSAVRDIVSRLVSASPLAAFTAFTRDIGRWWTRHPLFPLSPTGDGVLRFDPAGPDGRLVTRFADGAEWEVGAVRHWLPGERLTFGWRLPSFAPDQATEVEVRFDAIGAEPPVTVEQHGSDSTPRRHPARHRLALMIYPRRLGD